MAVTVTERGRLTDIVTNDTHNAVPFTGSLAAGRTVVVFINAPTGSVNSSVTVTDSKGNTYVTRRAVFGVSSHGIAVATSTLTNAVTASDEITVTLAVNCGNWGVVILDLGVVGGVDVSGSFASDGATHGTPTVSTNTAATADAQIVLAGFCNSNTTHTFTQGSGFTALPGGVVQGNTGTNARQLWVEYREYTTGSGAVRTATGTYATAAAYSAVVVAINVSGGGGGGGVTYPAEVGRLTSLTNATTNTVALTTGVAKGHKLAVLANTPTGTTNTSVVITDSKSNTYSTKQARFEAVYSPSVAFGNITTPLLATDTITITLAVNCGAWSVVVLDLGPVGAYDVSGSTADDGSTHANPATSTASATKDRQIVVAGFSNSNTTHTFTPDSPWVALPGGVIQANTGTSARQLWVAYRQFTTGSGAARTITGTYATAASYGAVIMAVDLDAGYVSQFREAGGSTFTDTERVFRDVGDSVFT